MIATIDEIVPESVYESETYTQSIVLELEDGTRLRAGDPTMRCTDEHVGETVDVDLEAGLAASIEPLSWERIDVDPTDPQQDAGIDRLWSTIRRILEPSGSTIPVVLALPAGELTFSFDLNRLPEGLPEDYEPDVGDTLRFDDVSDVRITSLSPVDEGST